jgi:hypothetical protein
MGNEGCHFIYDGGGNDVYLRVPSTSDVLGITDFSGSWANLCANIIYYNSLVTHSDRRLKKNIQPLASSLAFIEQLKPCSFEWIQDDGQIHYGLIAQEVQALDASLVGMSKHGTLSYDTIGIQTMMIKAIQELIAWVGELDGKL